MANWSAHCKDSVRMAEDVDPGSVHSVITDPPYGIHILGNDWDKKLPPVEIWKQCMTAMKPGAFLLSFAHRTMSHRLACQLEDIGFKLKDCLCWGYPDSTAKYYDAGRKIQGVGDEVVPNSKDEAKRWAGWGSALKISWEPILVMQKPWEGSLYENLMVHHVGMFNIDECRIPWGPDEKPEEVKESFQAFEGKDLGNPKFFSVNAGGKKQVNVHPNGRHPPNMIWTDELSDTPKYNRIFVISKPSRREKGRDNPHDTVKPIHLLEWLIRLVTPTRSKAGEDILVMDPFMGSGTTGVACKKLGRHFVGYENDKKVLDSARRRLARKQRGVSLMDR